MSDRSGSSKGLLLVISGPSGVGKTTIVRAIVDRLDGVFSVSATTRPRTDQEVDGRDYFFISQDRFREMIDRGEFLEYAEVFGDNWYGTPRPWVDQQLAEGRLVVLEIDVQGGLQVAEKAPDAFLLFIAPPSEEDLLTRLRGRGREDEQAIQKRFAVAQREVSMARESGRYDAFIVNDDLDRAIDEACALIRQHRDRDGSASATHPG